MPPRKHTPPSHKGSREGSIFSDLDDDDDDLLDDDLSDLDALDALDDLLWSSPLTVTSVRRTCALPQVTAETLGKNALSRGWLQRVEHCGTDAETYSRGLDELFAGRVRELQVQRGRVTADVGRHRLAVDILLPAAAQTGAIAARVRDSRSTLSPGAAQVAAVTDAILAAGPLVFPTRLQMSASCTCGVSPACEHLVATIVGLGVCLDTEPDLLLTLWGFDVEESRASAAGFVPNPLPANRRPVKGDLGALFGIVLAHEYIPVAAPVAAPEPLLAAKTKAKSKTKAKGKPKPDADTTPPSALPEVRRDYLRVLGLPPKMIDAWVREGVLRATSQKNVYERTPEASRRIAEYLEQ